MDHPDRFLGTVIDGRYRLSEYIGSGSYGSVYAADEVMMGRVISKVAIKLIIPENAEQRVAVLNEIVGLARLYHDFIIVYRSSGEVAYGDLAGAIFLATELGDKTLDQLVKVSERPPDGELRELVRGVASALAHIHTVGAIHGDVKPANILRVKGRWKLGDLGLLRSQSKRRSGPLQGSLTYIAPEMLRHEFSPANDIYALGVTILNTLTGKYAHHGDSREEFVENLKTLPPTIPPSVTDPWRCLITRCLQRNPAHRLRAEQIEELLRNEAQFAKLTAADLPMGPRMITVSADGTADCISIQDAVWQAAAGDEVVVRPGRYRESVQIDRPIHLLADGPVAEVVISTRDARCLEIATEGDVLIRGFTLRTRPAEENQECYAVDIAAGRPILEECIIRSQALACVAIHDGADPTIVRCTIFGSQDAGVFSFAKGRGIIEECRIQANGRAGITVGEGGRIVLRNCHIAQNNGGAFIYQDGVAKFEACEIIQNAKAGVIVGTGGRATLKRCTISENQGEGVVMMDGALAEVTDSHLVGNTRGPWRVAERCDLRQEGNEES